MFCPKCGIQNPSETKYCRGCGYSLTAHHAALEGKVADAATYLRKGSEFVGAGLLVLGICKLNILLNYFLGGDKFGVILNLLILLLIAVPLVALGVFRLARAKRALGLQPLQDDKALAEADTTQLTAAPTTGSIIEMPSVTEHTTLELKAPERTG
jgi:hypothetical protein